MGFGFNQMLRPYLKLAGVVFQERFGSFFLNAYLGGMVLNTANRMFLDHCKSLVENSKDFSTALTANEVFYREKKLSVSVSANIKVEKDWKAERNTSRIDI